MLRNRLFILFIAIALLVLVVLTVREAAATSSVVAGATSADHSVLECASLPSRNSIHNKYVKEMGAWVSYSEDGPTGMDGGLTELLSSYRTCR